MSITLRARNLPAVGEVGTVVPYAPLEVVGKMPFTAPRSGQPYVWIEARRTLAAVWAGLFAEIHAHEDYDLLSAYGAWAGDFFRGALAHAAAFLCRVPAINARLTERPRRDLVTAYVAAGLVVMAHGLNVRRSGAVEQ